MNGKIPTLTDLREAAYYDAKRLLEKDGIDPLTAPAHLWHNTLDFASRRHALGPMADSWFAALTERQWRLFRLSLAAWQNGEIER